jgi:hypothetical protein
MATVEVRNLLAPDEDSTASMGNLAPIDFVAGIATMEEEVARELAYSSPYFELVNPPPPEGGAQAAPSPEVGATRSTARVTPTPIPAADKEV